MNFMKSHTCGIASCLSLKTKSLSDKCLYSYVNFSDIDENNL